MSFIFNPNIPYYYQIKEDILRKIENGVFRLGQQLPPENQLVEEYGVSRPTIRQAIVELVQDGLLVRGRGKGTFVTKSLISSNVQVFSTFAETMKIKGFEQRAKLIKINTIIASEHIANDLQIPVGSKVYEIVRLRFGDGEPLVIRSMQISADKFPDFLNKDLETDSLYSIFQQKYGVFPVSATQTFQAVLTSKYEADLFEIDIGTPLMHCEGVIYSIQKTPIERVKALYRGDRFSFTVNQGRNMEQDTFGDIGIGILDSLKGGDKSVM